MTTPDQRRTIDAVRQVRAVWPRAVMKHRTRIDGKAEFNVHMDNVEGGGGSCDMDRMRRHSQGGMVERCPEGVGKSAHPVGIREARRLVKNAWPTAILINARRHGLSPKYAIVRGAADSAILALAYGETPKEAWNNALPKAFAKALTQ